MLKNDITGDFIVSNTSSDAFRNNWDCIFNCKKDNVLLEETNDDGVIIFAGSKVFVKLNRFQYNSLVLQILKKVTAEHVSEALKGV